jgi:DUF971 family protein
MKALLQCSYNRGKHRAAVAPFKVGYHRKCVELSRFIPDAVMIHPTEIVLHQGSKILEVSFTDGNVFRLPCELLRVYSPSAEVRGHGPGQEVLQTGKQNVNINSIEPVGTYGVRLIFSDGHDTGLYSWDYLHGLGVNQDRLWQEYLTRLEKAGAKRTEAAASPQPPEKPGWKKL